MAGRQLTKDKNMNMADNKNKVVCMVKGLSMAYALTCTIFIAYALLLTYTDMSEQNIGLVSVISTVIATALAGYDTAKGTEENGMIWGIATGVLYAFIMFVICFFAGGDLNFDSSKMTTLLISVAGGGLGGVMGVNTKRKRR